MKKILFLILFGLEGIQIYGNYTSPNDAHYYYAIPMHNQVNGTHSVAGAVSNGNGVHSEDVLYNGNIQTVTINTTNGNILPGGIQNNGK